MDNIIEDVYRILKDAHFMYEIYDHSPSTITLEISGDWKHSHLRADYLMNQNGYERLFETVTEDNGSDSYKSIHFYVKEDLCH